MSERDISNYEAPTSKAVKQISHALQQLGSDYFIQPEDGGRVSKLDRIMQFIAANCEYKFDRVNGRSGYAQFPIETLIRGGGDCEDLVNLAASFVTEMTDYQPALVLVPGHAMLGIQIPKGSGEQVSFTRDGKDYLLIECTRSRTDMLVSPRCYFSDHQVGPTDTVIPINVRVGL